MNQDYTRGPLPKSNHEKRKMYFYCTRHVVNSFHACVQYHHFIHAPRNCFQTKQQHNDALTN